MGGRTERRRLQPQPPCGEGKEKAGEDVACRKASEAFCNCLDRSCGGGGYIDEALALRVWPLLTRHVDGTRVQTLERQLRKRVEPIGRKEWLELMDVICSIGGMRMFTSAVLNAWVLLEQGRLSDDSRALPGRTSSKDPRAKKLMKCSQSHKKPANVSLCCSSESAPECMEKAADPSGPEEPPCQALIQVEKAPKVYVAPTRDMETILPRDLLLKAVEVDTHGLGVDAVGSLMADQVNENKDAATPSMLPSLPSNRSQTETVITDLFLQGRVVLQSVPALTPNSTSNEDVALATETFQRSASNSSGAEACAEQQALAQPEAMAELSVRLPSDAQEKPVSCDSCVFEKHALQSGGTQSELAEPLQFQDVHVNDVQERQASSPDTPRNAKAGPSESLDSLVQEAVQAEEDMAEEQLLLGEQAPAVLEDEPDAAAQDEVSPHCLERSKSTLLKRKSTKEMRRCTSQPLAPAATRVVTLPPLPKAKLAVSNVVRLANAVDNWKAQHFAHHRIGNVVQANKAYHAGGIEVKLGQRGRIVNVVAEFSVDILLSGEAKATTVPKSDLSHFDLCVVTHEIELIDAPGQRTGKFLACIMLRDHEDGFYDVLCQDGREKHFVHTTYLRELTAGMYTDVGYVSAKSSSAALDAKKSGFDLPPAGYIGSGIAVPFKTGAGSSLAMARFREKASKKQEDQRKEEALHVPARSEAELASIAAIEPGSCVCPFMEIQDGGLRCFMALSNFTLNDTVVDIGCGHGKILNKILECYPCKGIGVEVNTSVGKVAEQRLRKYGDRAKVVMDDIRKVDLQDATVTVSYLLSHSFDANGGAIKDHLSKSLRPGSVVLNYTYPVPGWTGSLQHGIHKYIIGEHLAG